MENSIIVGSIEKHGGISNSLNNYLKKECMGAVSIEIEPVYGNTVISCYGRVTKRNDFRYFEDKFCFHINGAGWIFGGNGHECICEKTNFIATDGSQSLGFDIKAPFPCQRINIKDRFKKTKTFIVFHISDLKHSNI